MLSVISNIDCNILYFSKLPSKSIISLLFGELSNIDYFFTFLGIDYQPWLLLGIEKDRKMALDGKTTDKCFHTWN